MSERALGDQWVAAREAAGAWCCKLPASTTSGIPDWLVLHGGIELWEAKLAAQGPMAYRPEQLRGSQRFFMRMLARYAPDSGGVLVLAPEGYVELPAREALRALPAGKFARRRRPYL